MSELPSGWASLMILDVLAEQDDGRKIHQGWSPQCEKEPCDSPEEWGVLKTTAIQAGEFLWQHHKKLPAGQAPRSGIEVTPGDLLLTCAGPRVRCGIACLVRTTRPKLMLSGKMYRFRPLQAAVDSRYLESFLQTQEAQAQIDSMKTGGSDSGLNLTHERFSSLRVRIAPYPEQLRIVAKLEELLSEIDAGVAELKAAQRKLARYRQSLLKAAVEGALTAEWRRQHTPSESGAQLLERILAERRARWEAKQLAKLKEQGKTPPKDWQQKYPEPVKPDTTNLSELPEGWVWASVDQLSVVVRGASPRPAGDPRFFGGDIPWITVGSLTADDSMYLTSVEQFVTAEGKEASRFIEAGTLLLTNSGATLGVPKITNIGGCINDGSVALLDVNAPLQAYLYWFLRTQTEKLRATNQGAAQPNLNTDIVKRICVPLCPAREMDLINDHLNAHTLVIQELRLSIMRALKQATAQRQNILRAAFAGELVPQDPNDEPACVLLERIRAERAAAAAAARPNTPRAPRSRRTKA